MEHDVHHHQLLQQQQTMELPPGFRFHPTDEELITHYLTRKAADPRFAPRAVGEADLNKCEPWDLPARATMGEKEWYFFCVKDRKYPTGLRTNRATESGYWKATGKDREIFRGKALVGMKKTLVFYTGRAPRGGKTGWVMHEYRLDGKHAGTSSRSSLIPSIRAGASKDEWVLCRVFKKSIEPPLVAAGGKRSSGPCVEVADVVGPSSMSMADDLAACALPPLMDVSGGSGGGAMSLSAVAGIELPPPAQHVTCFSNALQGQFLNPPFLLPSAGPAAAADHHLAMASSASPFLASMMQAAQYDGAADVGGMVHELLQEGGGWYSKLGERERLSGGGGASQDTGLTSEVNPGEISSRQHMDHAASLWGY
ncbi:hypothetical protein SEVIR_1G212500v4 [Setaria viridis]|uniref:NAC domain-containing protein n=1 Tax=Setaria viridis TaxID=4556 RepID=A0A4U6WDU5_SETVI|nr:NAC domain-containing protein 92-like [Setaria viridis]XP_034579191.1 NAC domain-containing protein 92-like [Setaria viridis]TKW39932.1 hypothetical protein SEVIR_1G212500v2 [Setaria viridis]TKW39933.1 hypothetical protein SEVIR_1G212500v2 [Setaria viridis]